MTESQIEKQMVKNIEWFVNAYCVKSEVDDSLECYCRHIAWFDHCRLYKCRTGYVYIVSPYAEYDDNAIELGFERILNLYYITGATYAKKFNGKVEWNRFMRSLKTSRQSR